MWYLHPYNNNIANKLGSYSYKHTQRVTISFFS
jgi:hypothetical protein